MQTVNEKLIAQSFGIFEQYKYMHTTKYGF